MCSPFPPLYLPVSSLLPSLSLLSLSLLLSPYLNPVPLTIKPLRYLDFDAFLSLVSAFLQHDELIEQVEADFEMFCRTKDTRLSMLPASSHHAVIKAGLVTSSYNDDDERIKIITPEDVKAVLEKYVAWVSV